MIDLKDDDFYNGLATEAASSIVSGALGYMQEKKLNLRVVNHEAIMQQLNDQLRTGMAIENAKVAARRIPKPFASPLIIAAAYFGALYHHGWEVAKNVTSEVK